MAGEDNVADGTLVKRLGSPAEIVGPALLLASSAGAYLTGINVPTDGGMLLSRM